MCGSTEESEETEPDEETSKKDERRKNFWLGILSRMDGIGKSCCPDGMGREADLNHQFNESYDVELLMESFAYSGTGCSVKALYNSDSLASFGLTSTGGYGGVALAERRK